MQLQSDSLKRELAQQKHESDVAQLKWQLAERDKEVSALRNELVRREKTVDKQRMELEDAMRHIEELQYAQVWDNINPLIFKSNQCVTSPQCIHVTNCWVMLNQTTGKRMTSAAQVHVWPTQSHHLTSNQPQISLIFRFKFRILPLETTLWQKKLGKIMNWRVVTF